MTTFTITVVDRGTMLPKSIRWMGHIGHCEDAGAANETFYGATLYAVHKNIKEFIERMTA